MIRQSPGFVTLSILLLTLTGCSTIKSWFPDKEKDYQFRFEIAPLQIPADLKAKSIKAPPAKTPQQLADEVARKTASATDIPPEAEKSSPIAEQIPSASSKPTMAAPVPSSVASIQIDQKQAQATRIVGQALSRQKIEVIERNMAKGYFFIKFDLDAVKYEDETFWDEINFLIGEDPSHEQEYRVSIQEIGPELSEVSIQDSDGNSLSNRTATGLLKLIVDAINQEIIPSSSVQETKTTPE